MIFIIGGAYQGKLTYAKERFGFDETQICDCAEETPDFSKPCIRHTEEYVYRCIQENGDPMAFFRENKEKWADSVLIMRDIFCGVVPMGADMRAWREASGRLAMYLSGEAEEVYRLFCGLEQKIK